MKKTLSLMLASGLVVVGLSTAWGQDDGQGPEFYPVETYTCNYNDGKGPADLDQAVDAWTEYMDSNDANNYFAMTLTPQMYGGETFDVGWLGAGASGESMGNGLDQFRQNPEVGAQFDEVLSCDSHSLFASLQIKQPPERSDPNNIVLSFSDCTVKEGIEFDALFGAMDVWAAWQAENGYGNGTWALFPVHGAGGDKFDFKLVNAWDNHGGRGKDFDLYGTGGGYVKRREIMSDMLDCDTSRVYDGSVRRAMADDS